MSESKTARYFSYYVDTGPNTQQRIAEQCGYKRANVISMFKTGSSPIPINKIPCLAKAIGCDPKRFLRTALEEYHPAILEVAEDVFGQILSDNEKKLLDHLRAHLQDRQLRLNTETGKLAVDEFVQRLSQQKGGALEEGD